MPRRANAQPEKPTPVRPQPASQAADPSSVARRIERVLDIVQVRGIFERTPGLPDELLKPEFYNPPPTVELLDDGVLYVMLEFGFAAFSNPPNLAPMSVKRTAKQAIKPQRRMAVEAGFVVAYHLKSGEPLSKTALDAFAHHNGRLTLTPYWREFLDSSLRRAGFPPLLAPAFNFEPQAKPAPIQKS